MRRGLHILVTALCMLGVLVSPVLAQAALPAAKPTEEACPYCSGAIEGACPSCERMTAANPAEHSCCGHVAGKGHESLPCCDSEGGDRCPGPCPCCTTTAPALVLILDSDSIAPLGAEIETEMFPVATLLQSRADEPQSPVPRV